MDQTEAAAGQPECMDEMTSPAVVEAIINQVLDYDVEKVSRLKWAQDNAASHSRGEAIRLMRASVNQYAFKNVDGGKRWDPVDTNEAEKLATHLKSIDERTDGASADQSQSSENERANDKGDGTGGVDRADAAKQSPGRDQSTFGSKVQQVLQGEDRAGDDCTEPSKPGADRYQQLKRVSRQAFGLGSPSESEASESAPATAQEQILMELTTHIKQQIKARKSTAIDISPKLKPAQVPRSSNAAGGTRSPGR